MYIFYNFFILFIYFKDKVVLVIRCGIGLLPLMCVRNGYARKVIALEESACIEYARLIIKDNGYSSKITLIQSSVITIFFLNFIFTYEFCLFINYNYFGYLRCMH